LRYRIRVRGERYRVTATRLIALTIAAILFVLAAHALGQAATPLEWPTVAGRITDSHVQKVFVGIHIGRYENWPVYESRFFVKYQYVVDAKTYTGTRVDASSDSVRRYPLTGERRYPVGTVVLVHYRPSSPTDSVLELSVPWWWVFGLICAAGLGWLALSAGGPIETQVLPNRAVQLEG
jgi:hypothetical protein